MRSVRSAALAALALAVFSPGLASGVTSQRARCAIPHGWRVVIRDREAVVIARRHRQYSPYDYCNRTTRAGWRRLATLGPYSGFDPSSLRLSGRYAAYVIVTPPPASSSIELWDTRTRQHNVLLLGGDFVAIPSIPVLLLSPRGVAAAIVVTQSYVGEPKAAGPPVATVEALGMRTEEQDLDSATPPSEIAGLQLYDCAAGCPSTAVVVSWTDNGQQRYAQIGG